MRGSLLAQYIKIYRVMGLNINNAREIVASNNILVYNLSYIVSVKILITNMIKTR